MIFNLDGCRHLQAPLLNISGDTEEFLLCHPMHALRTCTQVLRIIIKFGGNVGLQRARHVPLHNALSTMWSLPVVLGLAPAY